MNKYNKRKARGLCVYCGASEHDEGVLMCKQCRARKAQYHLGYRHKNIAYKLCPQCRAPLRAESSHVLCDECLVKYRTTSRERYRANVDKMICPTCSKLPSQIGRYCYDCWFKAAAAKAKIGFSNGPMLKRLLEEQDYRCVYSGKRLIPGVNASVDHIVPRSRGGADQLSNIQWVDFTVNMMKRDLCHDEFLALVHSIYLHDTALYLPAPNEVSIS